LGLARLADMSRVLILAVGALGLLPVVPTSNGIRVAPEPVADSLPSPAGPGSAEPSLAVGPDGRVYMSWFEPQDSGYALKFSAFDGRTWATPRTIRSGRDFFVNWADFPSIAVLGPRHLAAHWLQRTGKSSYAYGVRIAQSLDGGATWSEGVRPHTDSADVEHGFVAMWKEGGALGAAWLDGRKFVKGGGDHEQHNSANEMTVVTSTLSSTGKRGAEVTVDSRSCDCCQTAAAVTSAGPIIAYRDRSAEEIRDIYVVRRVKGKWTSPKAVHADNWHIAACPVNGPSVSAAGSRVALAWFTGANDSARVKLAFSSDAGATFTAPVRIDEGTPAGRVDTELLPDGSALVTWVERTGGDTARVMLRRVRADRRSGPAVSIASSSAQRASGFPRMVIAGEHAYFAYTLAGRPSQVKMSRIAWKDVR
jgi:hypothetical protein